MNKPILICSCARVIEKLDESKIAENENQMHLVGFCKFCNKLYVITVTKNKEKEKSYRDYFIDKLNKLGAMEDKAKAEKQYAELCQKATKLKDKLSFEEQDFLRPVFTTVKKRIDSLK